MSKNKQYDHIRVIRDTLKTIPEESWQRFANESKSIEVSKSEDGRGLSTGADLDYHTVTAFLPDELGNKFQKYHKGEADFKISDNVASFKTLRSKGEIALSWSKNPVTKKDGSPSIDRKFLDDPIPMVLYIRETKRWWEKGPKNPDSDLIWNKEVEAGFYLVNMHSASKYITLKANNKSDSIIGSKDIYKMLMFAKDEGNFIRIPEANRVGRLRFDFDFDNE
tara:strand:- start:314 stop:979 length:666 start_codon:yes stop_codon:yes gene_type:complete